MYLLYLSACLGPGSAPGPGSSGQPGGAPRDDTGEETAAPEPSPAWFLFGDAPIEVALTLDEAAIAGLARSASESPPDVSATFTWEDQPLTVGVRLKGGQGSFRTFEKKPSFTVDFGGMVEGQRFDGLRYLHLNNLVQDTSMLGEHAAYALFEARGVHAPRHGYARLTVNGEPFGLYGIVDKVDVDVLERCFARADGTLFEGEMDDLEDYLVDDFAVVRDDGHGDPYAALYAVVDALDAAPWDARGDVLRAHFDLDQVLDVMAAELVSGNDDGYVSWTNNFFLWREPEGGRMTMIPWGPDQAFQERPSLDGSRRGRLWNDCRNDPSCHAELRARLLAAAEVLEDPAWRARIDAAAAATEADCLVDPRSETAGATCVDARADLFRFLGERPTEVRAALGDP